MVPGHPVDAGDDPRDPEHADDPRVAGVVAAEVFSDLRTVARERAPFVLRDNVIERAFTIAEERGQFKIDVVDVSAAARRITRPVLLIHGADDSDTTPDHSRRVYDALAGPKDRADRSFEAARTAGESASSTRCVPVTAIALSRLAPITAPSPPRPACRDAWLMVAYRTRRSPAGPIDIDWYCIPHP